MGLGAPINLNKRCLTYFARFVHALSVEAFFHSFLRGFTRIFFNIFALIYVSRVFFVSIFYFYLNLVVLIYVHWESGFRSMVFVFDYFVIFRIYL